SRSAPPRCAKSGKTFRCWSTIPAGFGYVRIVESITPDALDVLCRYHWPGNVRELRNVIEYALGKSKQGGLVRLETLPDSVQEGPPFLCLLSFYCSFTASRKILLWTQSPFIAAMREKAHKAFLNWRQVQ